MTHLHSRHICKRNKTHKKRKKSVCRLETFYYINTCCTIKNSDESKHPFTTQNVNIGRKSYKLCKFNWIDPLRLPNYVDRIAENGRSSQKRIQPENPFLHEVNESEDEDERGWKTRRKFTLRERWCQRASYHTHTRTHTHTLFLSYIHTLSLTHKHYLSHAHTLALSLTNTHIQTRTLLHTHTLYKVCDKQLLFCFDGIFWWVIVLFNVPYSDIWHWHDCPLIKRWFVIDLNVWNKIFILISLLCCINGT